MEERFQVVICDREQRYSIWPERGEELPEGWRRAGHEGTRAECLAFIDRVWTLRPLTTADNE